LTNKKGCLAAAFSIISVKADYLFITYIVTSKPKRISVAAGLVHMIIFLYSLVVKFVVALLQVPQRETNNAPKSE
jgi:hypothetical protein